MENAECGSSWISGEARGLQIRWEAKNGNLQHLEKP